jgi:hypothetical protein
MRTRIATLCIIIGLLPVINVTGQSTNWNLSASFSSRSNPNGVWSYGRRWSPEGYTFQLLPYLLNGTHWIPAYGVWSPSIQGGPLVWADNNAQGYPVVRWTCPAAGTYKIECAFVGADSRGDDLLVWVVANGTPIFSGEIHGYGNSAPCTNTVSLQQNAVIDFVVKWDNRVAYRDANWTRITGTISSVPPPSAQLAIRTSQVELCWETDTNKWYQLQYRSGLTTNNWVPLMGNWLPGNGNRFCTNDWVPPSQPQRFYRVLVTDSAPAS